MEFPKDSDEIQTEVFRHILERKLLAKRVVIPRWMLEKFGVDVIVDETADTFIAQLTWHLAGQTLKDHVIAYPTTWWEHLKERFAPKWFLERWPIKWTVHQYRADALYPSIALPEKENGIVVYYSHDIQNSLTPIDSGKNQRGDGELRFEGDEE